MIESHEALFAYAFYEILQHSRQLFSQVFLSITFVGSFWLHLKQIWQENIFQQRLCVLQYSHLYMVGYYSFARFNGSADELVNGFPHLVLYIV